MVQQDDALQYDPTENGLDAVQQEALTNFGADNYILQLDTIGSQIINQCDMQQDNVRAEFGPKRPPQIPLAVSAGKRFGTKWIISKSASPVIWLI